MTSDEVFEEFKGAFRGRKFVAGLLVAMIDLLDDVHVFDPGNEVASFDGLLQKYPRATTTSAGKNANTLILQVPDGPPRSLRPHYNAIERFFRGEKKRFDYPNCAPHATQAWPDYMQEAMRLKSQVIEYVLAELPSQAFDPSTVSVDPPVFRLLLEDFDFSAHKGERPGSALDRQGPHRVEPTCEDW
jgi:hypothetical protein